MICLGYVYMHIVLKINITTMLQHAVKSSGILKRSFYHSIHNSKNDIEFIKFISYRTETEHSDNLFSLVRDGQYRIAQYLIKGGYLRPKWDLLSDEDREFHTKGRFDTDDYWIDWCRDIISSKKKEHIKMRRFLEKWTTGSDTL